MDATTMGRVRGDLRIGLGSAVAYIGAVAFVIAAGWYILAVKGVTAASEPEFSAGLSEEEKLRIFFKWVVSTLPQERLYTSIAIVGFICLAATVIPVRNAISRGSSAALVGAFAVSIGSTLWIVGNVVQLGAHRAVGVMVTHPAGSLSNASDLFFTTDLIDDAFEVTAFALIGVGMLALAASSFGSSTNLLWMGSTIAIGIATPVTSIAYLADQGDLTNLLLLLGGVVLLPAWLVATGRLLARPLMLDGRPVQANSNASSSQAQVAPGGPWARSLGITAAIACATLLILVAIISSTGSGFRGSAQPPVVAPASRANADEISATGLQEAGAWIEGLADGLILPSDVTSRLAVQDPRTARIVMAAWSDLSAAISADSPRAASWVEGLAHGLILPSDVTSRLAGQDPRTARIVMAAWSDLNP